MDMITVHLKEDYIRLGQALKAAGIVSSGTDAKFLIKDGQVSVDGITELRRGRKLYEGAVVEYKGQKILIQ